VSLALRAAWPVPRRMDGPALLAGSASYLPVPLSCTVLRAHCIFDVQSRSASAGVRWLEITAIVQSHPALRLDPQADFALKSPGSVPPNVMLLTTSDLPGARPCRAPQRPDGAFPTHIRTSSSRQILSGCWPSRPAW
jgi:hypothetical protein